MWLWFGLCLASAVIAENTILATGSLELPKKHICEEVLLKIWTIFANLLDADGETIKIPSRNHVQYALTLIKKSILENEDNENGKLTEKLFLREAELAKHKGVYLYDNRPLQALLDQELIPYENSNVMFKYELRTNNKPDCREAFRKLIQTTHDSYSNLANSPVCIEEPINAQTLQYGLYYPEFSNQMMQLNNIKNPTRNRDEKDQIATLNTNVNNIGLIQRPQLEVSKLTSTVDQQSSLNTVESNSLLHAVKLSKETKNLLGSDYNADLEHAKGVADKMNTLYQANNWPLKYTIPHKPLRGLNTNAVSVSTGVLNNPSVTSSYPKPTIMQESYLAQSQTNMQSNINRERELSQQNSYYSNLPPQGIHNNFENQSYTLMTNTVQSQAPVYQNTILNQKYTKPFSTFENAKYHPNPTQSSEGIKEELVSNTPIANYVYTYPAPVVPKLKFKLHKHPYQNKKVIKNPQNIADFSDTLPTITNANQPIQYNQQRNNNYNNNAYSYLNPFSSNGWNYLQSNAYKLGQNTQNPSYFSFYTNKYYPTLSASRPSYLLGYNNNNLGLNTQTQFTMQKYFSQNYPDAGGQNIPFSQSQTYIVNANNRPLRYDYGNGYNNNLLSTQQSNYYNGQPVIDKLANWISGTNSVKLNSDFDTEAEIELTYRVNRPTPMYQPNVFYIKFRMPYKAFSERIGEFLKMQNSRDGSTDADLYNLASQYNATVVPTDTTGIPEEEILSPDGKLLVRARYIQPNELDNNMPNSVDIINLDREAELDKVDLENSVNNVERDA